MEHIRKTLKNTGIIKLNAFWKKSKTTPQAVGKIIDDGTSDTAFFLKLTDIKSALGWYLDVVSDLSDHNDSYEDLDHEYYGKFFTLGNLEKKFGLLPDIQQELVELQDYIDEQLSTLAGSFNGTAKSKEVEEDMEELSGIFDEEEDEGNPGIPVGAPSQLVAVPDVHPDPKTEFLKNETDDEFVTSQTGRERFAPKPIPSARGRVR